jgi:hypothetical protein
MHNVRVMWLTSAAKGSKIPNQLDRAKVTAPQAGQITMLARQLGAVGSEGANVFCMARSRKLKFTHGTQPRNLLRRSSLLHKLGGLARGLLGWGFAPGRLFSSYSLIPED